MNNMPIIKLKKGGYKYGNKEHVYPTRAGAIRQMKAMFASGYRSNRGRK